MLTRDVTEGMKGVVVALQDADEARFEKLCDDASATTPTDPDGWPLYLEYTRMILKPLTTDARFEYTRPFAREAVAYLVRNGKRIVMKDKGALPTLPKPIKMPSEMTFVNRLQWGFASVLAMMQAEANWRALIEPWVRGEYVAPPR